MEKNAEAELTPRLHPLLDISKDLINFLPTITSVTKRKSIDDTSGFFTALLQHIFLRQALTCLRSITILLVRGYTVQAATLASSIFEIYLYSSYIGNDPEKAEKFRSHSNSQEFVWSPKSMIRYLAENSLKAKKQSYTKDELEQETQTIDGPYIYFCSLKHNNPIPLWHNMSAKMDEERLQAGAPKFMVIPDQRSEDDKPKIIILAESNQKTIEIAQNTLHLAETKGSTLASWEKTLQKINQRNLLAYQEMCCHSGPMPYPTVRKQKP